MYVCMYVYMTGLSTGASCAETLQQYCTCTNTLVSVISLLNVKTLNVC